MTTDLHYLASSAVLTFVMLLGASLLKARGWTPAGFLLALSNRDHMPEPSPISIAAQAVTALGSEPRVRVEARHAARIGLFDKR